MVNNGVSMAHITVIDNKRDHKHSTSEMSDAKFRQGTFLKKKKEMLEAILTEAAPLVEAAPVVVKTAKMGLKKLLSVFK